MLRDERRFEGRRLRRVVPNVRLVIVRFAAVGLVLAVGTRVIGILAVSSLGARPA